MIEDLMADSKRWDEELRRSSRNRGAKPGRYRTSKVKFKNDLTYMLQPMKIPRYMKDDR